MSSIFVTKENLYSKIMVYEFNNINELDTVVYGMLSNNNISGLLDASFSGVDNYYSFTFNFENYVKLKNIISKLSISKVYRIIKSVSVLLDEIYEYLIPSKNVVFSLEYAFINPENYEIVLPCVPAEIENTSDYADLVKEIVDKNLVIQESGYSEIITEMLEKEKNCQSIVEFLEKIAIKNQLTTVEEKETKEFEESCYSVKEECKSKNSKKTKKTKKSKSPSPDSEKGKLKDKISKLFEKKKKSYVLEEKEEEYVSFFNDYEDKEEELSQVEKENAQNEQEYSNETVVISRFVNNNLNYPYLLRSSNSEKININKEFFVIGKEEGMTDYTIEDNGSISRLHAEIIKADSNYYIKDRNSRNGTWVNGIEIDKNIAVKIEHNSRILLSNEEFVFKAI